MVVAGSGVVAGGRGVRILITNFAFQKFVRLCHPANFVIPAAVPLLFTRTLSTSTFEMGVGQKSLSLGGPVDGAAWG